MNVAQFCVMIVCKFGNFDYQRREHRVINNITCILPSPQHLSYDGCLNSKGCVSEQGLSSYSAHIMSFQKQVYPVTGLNW